jgi:hypothetical protein
VSLFRYGNVVIDRDKIIGLAYERKVITVWPVNEHDCDTTSWQLLALCPGMSVRIGDYPTETEAVAAFEDAIRELEERM